MATLIPTFGSCRWDSRGEGRFAERLLSHLEDDYLCWHNVPIGSAKLHPDFVILHPRRGVLVLEVKDWKVESIQSVSKTNASILTSSGVKTVANPLEQARQYAHLLNLIFERDPQLVREPSARHAGKLVFPWAYGVVLTNITRKQFDATDLSEVMPANSVICRDEMVESVDPEAFQQRLWNMFTTVFPCVLTLPQIDRIRWHLYPEIRVTQKPLGLFDEQEEEGFKVEEIPELIRVMDLGQEQLARSIGDGHRVIHGVAGSGKTMILGYRCQHLARTLSKPVLVLCYNKVLAAKLEGVVANRGLQDKVTVRNFHRWCRDQLVAYHVPIPEDGPEFSSRLVESVIRGLDAGQVPRAQYGAVLIDEGHDFEPEWLKLVMQMVDPETNSLLLLYDDAQSLYGKHKRRSFSFAEVGIQARGRSTILRLNYRNTAEVLEVAYEFAREVISPTESDEDGIPVLSPQSAGRHGPAPRLVKLPSAQHEVDYVVERVRELGRTGHAWKDMAVLYRSKSIGERIEAALRKAGIPAAVGGSAGRNGRWDAAGDSVKVLTMHSSKGLEFPVAIIVGVGDMPSKRDELAEEARLLYVAMTRAMEHLEITSHRDSVFTRRIAEALRRVA